MAQAQIGNILGVTAANVNNGVQPTNLNGGTAANPLLGLDLDNGDTIDSLRTRLTAISATAYSAANLNAMTYNDMVYALRVHDAPLTIKQ